MTMWMKLGGLTAIACMALTTAACGDDDDNPTPTPPAAGENVAHVTAEFGAEDASHKVAISFKVGSAITATVSGFDTGVPAAQRHEKFILSTGVTGQVNGGAAAPVTRVDDTHATLTVDVPAADGDYTLTVGPAAGTAVTLINLKSDGTTVGTQATLGQIIVHFSRKTGKLVIPTVAALAYPTGTSTKNLGASFKGLTAGTKVTSSLVSGTTTLTKSATATGTEANGTVIADLQGGITPAANSKLTLTFTAP